MKPLKAIDAEADPVYRLSHAFRRQVPVKFNCLLEYQARMEYGSESSIVSEPQTLGGLVLPLWGILTAQLPSVAQRPHEAAISSIHREFTDLRNIPRQWVISFFYLDSSAIYPSLSRHKKTFRSYFLPGFRFHSFVRRLFALIPTTLIQLGALQKSLKRRA